MVYYPPSFGTDTISCRPRQLFLNQTQAKTIDLGSQLSRPKSLVLFPVLGEQLREGEGEEGKMMLKIDEITHFFTNRKIAKHH